MYTLTLFRVLFAVLETFKMLLFQSKNWNHSLQLMDTSWLCVHWWTPQEERRQLAMSFSFPLQSTLSNHIGPVPPPNTDPKTVPERLRYTKSIRMRLKKWKIANANSLIRRFQSKGFHAEWFWPSQFGEILRNHFRYIYPNPRLAHTTRAAAGVNLLEHTVPQVPANRISSRPNDWLLFVW